MIPNLPLEDHERNRRSSRLYPVRMATTPDIEQIFAEHGPMITRIAATYEADPHHAADVVQEILVALWRALPHFRGAAAHVRRADCPQSMR